MSFSHCAQHLLAIFSKVQKFVQNSIFSPRSARFVFFTLGTPLFSVYSIVHELVQNSVFRTRLARFVIFALGAPLLGNFLQSARVYAKHRLLHELSTFFSYLHWADHFLAIFSKGYQFVQNSVFFPTSARFVNFALGAQLFSNI